MSSASLASFAASGEATLKARPDSKIRRRWPVTVGERFARTWIDWKKGEVSSFLAAGGRGWTYVLHKLAQHRAVHLRNRRCRHLVFGRSRGGGKSS